MVLEPESNAEPRKAFSKFGRPGILEFNRTDNRFQAITQRIAGISDPGKPIGRFKKIVRDIGIISRNIEVVFLENLIIKRNCGFDVTVARKA